MTRETLNETINKAVRLFETGAVERIEHAFRVRGDHGFYIVIDENVAEVDVVRPRSGHARPPPRRFHRVHACLQAL